MWGKEGGVRGQSVRTERGTLESGSFSPSGLHSLTLRYHLSSSSMSTSGSGSPLGRKFTGTEEGSFFSEEPYVLGV